MGLNAIKSTDEARAFNDKMNLIMQIRSMLGMMVMDSEDDIVNQPASISGFSDLADHIKDSICADLDMPRVVLFGESPGGLNSDGDSQRGSWQSQVEGKQQYAVLPALESFYRLVYAQKAGSFQGQIPDHFDVVFNPLHSPTSTELAEIRKETAEMDKIYIETGVYTAEQVRRGRFGIRGWQFDLPPLTPSEENTGEAREVFSLSEKQITTIQATLAALNAGQMTPQQARAFLSLAVPDLPVDRLQLLVAPSPAIPGQAAASTVATATDSADLPTITLEYQPGEVRSGVSDDGTPWESPPLPCGYGYFEGVPGLDGDEADVLQAGDWSGTTYVIEHRFPDGALDEYKAVVGVNTTGEALNLYSAVYGPAANYGRVHSVADDDLAAWLTAAALLAESSENAPDDTRADAAAPAKYEHISFVPPVGVADEARKGLEWRREHGRGGTGVGVARARDLSNRTTLSPLTVRRMARYFTRHQGDKKGKGYTPGEGFPSAGRVAWALWGGDPGRAWANKLVMQMNAADKA
jgi:hypothetical protein